MYSGYLSPHVDLIRDAHARGLSTREIAEALYAAGARADTSDPCSRLTRAGHIHNLRQMAAYALARLGLRPADRNPRTEALRARALALREAGWTLAKIGDALGLSQGQAHLLVRKAERLAYRPHWADGMPMRAQNFLRNREVYGLSEIEAARTVAQLSDREIMATPNVGKGACVALVAWLARHGLRLQPEISLKAARVSARSVPSTTIHPEKNSAATRQELAAEEGESKAWPLDTIQPLDATPR